jgi:two-component system response regulator PilR (NtrC family)
VPGRKRIDPLSVPLGNGFNLAKHLEEIQSQYLQRAMEEAGNVKTRAAELLGYDHYQTLDAQLKRLKVRPNVPRK